MAFMAAADVPRTIAELTFFASGRYPKPELVGRCDGSGVKWTSGRELTERVRDISLGLGTIGMTPGARVVLLSESRPEWLFADLAVVTAGAITTPLYPTLGIEQVRAILQDSQATIAIASTQTQVEKLAAAGTGTALTTIVVFDDVSVAMPPGLAIVDLASVTERGHRRILDGWGVAKEFQDAARRVRPEDPATLIYTSGTTGVPKGVLLTHGNLAADLAGCCQVLDLSEEDIALSFLPLCHAFERMVSYVYLTTGVSVAFAESVDTIARDLKAVKPTVMSGVPRVFEKLHARVLANAREQPALKQRLFALAMRAAASRGAALEDGKSVGALGRLTHGVFDKLVYSKIHESIGGRLRYAVSGGAPLSADLGRLFLGMGLPLLEGYGLTEAAPVLCVMPIGRIRFGTVGPALPNVELRVAGDGEVLARGPNIMSGYYQRPSDTADAIRDGWLHTGDIGTLDDRGYLHITDRKKELLVTSGGKKIAPQAIEAAFKAHEIVEEAVVIAEGRHFPSVLLVPDFGELCRHLGEPLPAGEAGARALIAREDVRARFSAVVDTVNAPLAQFERLKRFALLPRAFSVATGELTPTMKVKRRAVNEQYRAEIDGLYVDR